MGSVPYHILRTAMEWRYRKDGVYPPRPDEHRFDCCNEVDEADMVAHWCSKEHVARLFSVSPAELEAGIEYITEERSTGQYSALPY